MATAPVWADLVEEYEADVLGPLWLQLIQDVVASVVRSYPPSVYAETGEWTPDTVENVVQDVAVRQLLEQRQLDWLIVTATSTSTARALLHRIVRRTLSETRRRTVVDNLLDRCRKLRTLPPQTGPGAPTEAVLAAARDVVKLPRLAIRNEQRAPAVYTTATLGDILNAAARHLGEEFSERDLARVFEHVLASYLPSPLQQGDGRSSQTSPGLSPEEEVVAADVLTHLLDTMTAQQCTVVALKLADTSDSDVAAHLQVSRPTAAKRFREATHLIEQALNDLPARLQDDVLGALPQRLEVYLPAPTPVIDPTAPPEKAQP